MDPSPSAAEILNVSVASNNTEDGDDIVDLAHGVFETIEWSPHEDQQ